MKVKYLCVPVVLVLLECFYQVQSARVLGYFTSLSKSHLIIHMAVIRSLIEKGHDVTVVTTLSLEDTKNFRHIQLNTHSFPEDLLKPYLTPPKNAFDNIYRTMNFIPFLMDVSNKTLYEPEVQKLMATESFDLVILGYFMNDFVLGLGAHFKCPIVISWMVQPMKIVGDVVGLPAEPLYVPHVLSALHQPLGFKGRSVNLLVTAIDSIFSYFHYKKFAAYYEGTFPPDMYPSFDEVRKNVSLILVNHHSISQGPIRPMLPAVVEIGGIQVKSKPDPLPEDIQKFLDSSAPHGAIYFSLGSNVRGENVDQEKIAAIYKVFAGLKQKVLWTWGGDKKPGNSSNIFYNKWFPQDDILAHPNLKLFVTHGGAGSVVESQYHGVPMLAMPFMTDQVANARAVEESEFGVSLAFTEVTEELFRKKIKEVLENSIYKENIERFSKLYRDRPMAAKETAAYWLEYVIRHKGAKHIQSPAVHLNTIQYYGLDVIAFLLFVFYIIFKILVFISKKIFRAIRDIFCRNKASVKKSKKD